MKTVLSLAAAAAVAYVAHSETVAGLDAYGDLTLVDSIDCATDDSHEFHQYPDGGSKVETILGAPCRTLAHQSGSAAYFSYRLGEGKGLAAGDMYLLVAEYPDDVPRPMTLLKEAEDSAQFSADTPTFTLTVDADKPSLFAKIVISSTPYKAGDEL